MSTLEPNDLQVLTEQLIESFADARLSDEEKAAFTSALREAQPPEEGLRSLRNRAFELARSRTEDADTHALIKWLEGVVRALDVARAPAGSHRAQSYFSPGDECLSAINQRLRGARARADLCVFTISDDRITREVLAAHARGVAVRLITDNEKELDRGSDVAELRNAGVPVAVDRTSAHMHHKFALIDGQWLINGSYNWTRSAAEHNEENIVVCNDAALIAQFQREFDNLWRDLYVAP